MPMKLNENNYSYYIYRNLICLAILLHFGYTLLMGILHYGVPLLYNICSVLFYIGMLLLVMKKKRYALVVSLIHLETICFVVLHTVLFGWNASFFLFLIAMASLVYFCPYRSPYIPYLFSILHMLTFFYCMNKYRERCSLLCRLLPYSCYFSATALVHFSQSFMLPMFPMPVPILEKRF